MVRSTWDLGPSGPEHRAIAVSPDGKYIVSGSDDKTVKVWSLETGQEVRTLSGHTDSVNAVAVSPEPSQVG